MSGFRRSAADTGVQGNNGAHPFDPWHLASSLAALAGIGVGLVVFFGGWIGHIALLRTILPGTQSMKVNTALGLVCLGVALWVGNRHEVRGARHVALTSAVLANLIGTLTTLEYVTKRDFRIDELLVRDYARTVSTTSPGRMAVTTAISFALLGYALLFTKLRRAVLLSQSLALAVGACSAISLIGYIYGIQNYRGIAFCVNIAVHTSLSLLILSVGILASTAKTGFMATVTSKHLGGVLARRLLPAAALVPITIGWLRWQGQLRGYYDTAFGLALFTSVNVAIFVFLDLGLQPNPQPAR